MRVKQGLAWSVAFATSAAIGFYANASLAAPKIGVASAVNNHVESIDGDHHNVVGLSLPLLRRMLRDLGYALTDLGFPTR